MKVFGLMRHRVIPMLILLLALFLSACASGQVGEITEITEITPDATSKIDDVLHSETPDAAQTETAEPSQTEVSECVHSFGEWETVIAATCVCDGERIRVCGLCGEKESSVITKDEAHEETVIPSVPATCSEDGLTEGKECALCGAVLVKQETVTGGHKVVIDAAVAPTCYSDGLTEGKHCSVCGEVLVKQATLNGGHKEVRANAVAPTCTYSGHSEWKYCSVCGEVIVAGESIKQLNHTYTVLHGEKDEVYYKCAMCGDQHTVTNRLPALLESGALTPDGVRIDSAASVRTGFIFGDDIQVLFPSSVIAEVFYYSDTDLIRSSGSISAPLLRINDYAPAGTTSFRVVFSPADGNSATITISDELIAFQSFGKVKASVNEVPESDGVRNVLARFGLLCDITYVPLKNIPQTLTTFAANKMHKSLPYSSTRPEALFVPNNVSFYTFLTALQNPKSYIYTVDIGEAPLNNVNGKTYYGAVCSTATAYALGIVPNYSTHQWTSIPGMQTVTIERIEDLQLCDTIVVPRHVVMVTGIGRDTNGKVVTVDISEASGVDTHERTYSVEGFFERFPFDNSVVCRYSKLDEVMSDSLPEIAGEPPLMPRKGDKSNWLFGTTVEIDVLSTDYTHMELYCDGEPYKTVKLNGTCVSFNGLPAGKYSAKLIKGEKTSAACHFIVADVSSYITTLGNSRVKVYFKSSNAEPMWVQWTSKDNGTVHVYELTEKEKIDGIAYSTYKSGKFKVRVAFRTEYGIIHSELPDITYVP